MIGYSTVTQKGQVTIPSSIRRALELNPKARVVILHQEDGALIKLAPDIAALRGSVNPRTKPENFRAMRRAFIDYLSTKHHA